MDQKIIEILDKNENTVHMEIQSITQILQKFLKIVMVVFYLMKKVPRILIGRCGIPLLTSDIKINALRIH